VRAPFDGTVVEKHAVVGELVEPSNPVLLLSDLRHVWVWASVYGRDLAPLLEGQGDHPTPVRVKIDEFPSRIFEGAFDYFGATMDPSTRTVKARATVENPQLLLRPGMFCSVVVQLPESTEGIVVPTEAVLEDEGRSFVFRHLTEDLFIRCPVDTGARGQGRIEIVSGLRGGETIVTVGGFLLKSDVLREKMGAGCAD
jgi:cobalt-zinc-cadmium efflux system membrane fusion protein